MHARIHVHQTHLSCRKVNNTFVGDLTHRSMPQTYRLNDKTDPKRAERFESDCVRWACNPQEIMRHLVDSWRDYIKKHGHPPAFPVELRSADPEENDPCDDKTT
jgi:hypothetical protein